MRMGGYRISEKVYKGNQLIKGQEEEKYKRRIKNVREKEDLKNMGIRIWRILWNERVQ